MKRTDITDIFPDATPEQVDRLMGLNGADINKAKEGLTELQKQLDDHKASGISADTLKAEQEKSAKLQKELDGMKAAEALRIMRDKVSTEKGIPVHLLTGTTEEDCTAQADAILAFKGETPAYPSLPDGGEVHVKPQRTTRDSFAEWFGQISR